MDLNDLYEAEVKELLIKNQIHAESLNYKNKIGWMQCYELKISICIKKTYYLTKKKNTTILLCNFTVHYNIIM